MKTRKQTQSSFPLTAALLLALSANTVLADVPRPKAEQSAINRLQSMDAFETAWQVIEDYMASHALVSSYETKMAIKAETREGIHSWVCFGPGLGFPQYFGSIIFDSEASAAYCADLIIELAESQG